MSRSYACKRRPPRRARGVAMLVAIMLVALATIIAATIGYDSAMAARRATGTYAFDQSILIAEGAEGLAAYALKQVWQNSSAGGRTINNAQAWAQPVGPLEIVPGVNLDAQMEDLSGRFNVNSLLVADGTGALVPDPEARRAFQALLTNLGLPIRIADLVIDWINPSNQPQPDGAKDSFYLGQVPPYLPPDKYITSITELLALPEMGAQNYQALAPYITALPPDAKINVCTAPPQVLDAYLPGRREYSNDLDSFYKSRAAANGCYPTLNEYTQAYNQANPTAATANATAQAGATVPGMGVPAQPTAAAAGMATPGQQGMAGGLGATVANPRVAGVQGTMAGAGVPAVTGLAGHFQVTSSYFRLTSHISTDNGTEFYVYSLMYQDPSQGTARPILRSFTPD